MENLSAVPSADMKIPSDCLFKEMTEKREANMCQLK